MPLYREQGVVLRTHKLGETDRIVSILTPTRGKVRAVAKGVRRPGSRFGSRLEPTSHVALQLYEGRNLDTVTQVETVDSFSDLRRHLGALGAALALLEATDQVAQEQEANVPLYRMLVGALRALDREPSPLLVPAYFWKLLSLEGLHPELDACIHCGRTVDLVAMDPVAGGATCTSCTRSAPREAAAALAVVRRILGGDLAGALRDQDPPVVREVGRLAVRALEHHFERRLRSGDVVAALNAL